MADVDQSIVEHGVDQAAAPGLDVAVDDGLDNAVDHGANHLVDQGWEQDVDQGLEQDVDQGLEQDVDQGLEQDVDQGLEQDVDQGLEQDVDQGLEQDVDQGLEQDVDQGLDRATDSFPVERNVDHTGDANVDHAMEHNIENAEDHLPEDFQAQEKQGHDDDSVAGDGEKKWPGWPGESVFRMLVPAQKVGSIIGRKGEFIKKIVEETRARVKILDGPPGTKERAVMVSAKEEPDSTLPPAVYGLLRVHKRIVDGLEGDSPQDSGTGTKVSTRMLVPASQAGSLIGKQGGTVKSIQEASGCVVRVLGAEDLPLFALQDDRVVEVLGDPAGVHKAVELIASHLRKFLVDRSIIPLFEMHMQMSNHQVEHVPTLQSWGPPQGLPPNAGRGPCFGPNPQYMPPQRQIENYYPPTDLPPPMEKQPHQGISAYGREAPLGVHASTNLQAAPSMIKQITQQMQIPLAYADAVIGTAGASISYIRRASGATVAIQETRGVPGEMTVEISGTASEVQTAQQLIQNFMAEAAGPAQTQTGGSTDQGYNPYAAHGSVYAPPQSNSGHAGHTGGYGSVYGTNYGY